MRHQSILWGAAGCLIAIALTWLLEPIVHVQPFVQSLEAPASFVVAGIVGAIVGVVLRFSVRETFGL